MSASLFGWLVAGSATPGPMVSQQPPFVDATGLSGINFLHRNSPTEEKYLVETMGSGAAFLDYDNDGDLDVFLLNGGATPGGKDPGPFDHAFYRNQGDGTFKLVTSEVGIQSNRWYGMGLAVGDFQNDGYDDIFITNYGGPNILYQNNGNGTFSDVTETAGVGGAGEWSASAAFLDYDNDGFLDLYVTQYVDQTYENNRICGPLERGIRAYCTPHAYPGIPDLLYHNNRNGTFTDVSRQAGIALPSGKGLGVTVFDYDEDGFIDIYVANDSVPNFLFRNNHDGTFSESGLMTGTGLSGHGQPQAGMGTAIGDFDGDGDFDLAVTNLDFEYLALYRNLGGGFFEDVSAEVGVEISSRAFVGFGVSFLDFDNDADLDLLAVNGNVLDNAPLVREGATYRQRKLLLENSGRRFRDVTAAAPVLLEEQVSRGLALGDYDNDGDVDALSTNCGGPAVLLRNENGDKGSWLQIKLVGKRSNRNAIGARLELKAGENLIVRQVTSAGSYLSAQDLRVHFGLGRHEGPVSLKIRWPSGASSSREGIQPRQFLIIEEEP